MPLASSDLAGGARPHAVLAIIQSRSQARYVAAVALVAAAVALRLALDSLWGDKLPFITLFPAVMLSAWLGGLGPGLLATGLCLVAGKYFWLAPSHSLRVSDLADVLGVVIFGAIGTAVSVLQEAARRGARAVIESEERLNVTLASIGDAVIGTDDRRRIVTINTAAQRLTGWDREDAVGRQLDEVCVVIDEASGQVQRVDNATHGPSLLVTRQRQRIPIEISVAPVAAAGAKARGSLIVIRNLFERRQAERIRDEEERAARLLAAIVESSDDAIVSKNLDSIIQSWNAGAERMFGYPAAEAVGQSVRLIIPDDRLSEEDEVLRRLRLGERVEHFETVRQRKDGREILVSLTISPIHDRNGVVVGASKIARDVTALKAMEAERLQLLKENAAVTEQLNRVGAVVTSDLDRDTVVQAVTDVATELTSAEFGLFVYNVTGDTVEYALSSTSGATRDAFARFPMPRLTAIFEPTFGDGAVTRSDDLTRDPRYGALEAALPAGLIPVRSYLAVPVVGRSGLLLGGLFFGHSAVGHFTTQHERLAVGVASWASVALENSAMYVDAREASRLRDHFLATLSHELRTPLNAILGYARMLRSGMVASDKQPRAIQVIERNATALTQIVEDVLDVSRIVSGKLRLNVQVVELPDILRMSVDAILPTAEAKGIRVDATLDPDATPLNGDPERLQQVFWNLLSNAVKFTNRGGAIEVRLVRCDDHAEISIRDTGVGIAPEFVPYIFERFRQADGGPARERGGLGLGLSIARQLIEMHGGTIEATSAGPGHGSTFRLTVPLAHVVGADADDGAATSRMEAPEGFSQLPDLSGLAVLSVDDETDARRLVAEILEAAGARVVSANSAMEALERLDRDPPPDVILADVGMPHIDGFQFIDRVRHHRDARVRKVPAAALTAFARSEDRMTARRLGFQRHVAKPIDPVQLVTIVAALCRPVSTQVDSTTDGHPLDLHDRRVTD